MSVPNGTDEPAKVWTRAFSTFWTATSLSNLGSGVSLVALPVLAAQQLQAGAAQLGYLRALEAAPYLLLALIIGHLADRWHPLYLMITADVVRAFLLGGLVTLALTDNLNLLILYVIVFVVGTMTVTYDIAQFTFMPAIVAKPAMVPANSAVELARGAAFSFGPSLGGLLTAVLRAAPSLIVDAGSYVYSAIALATLRQHRVERSRDRIGALAGEVGRAADGLRFLFRHPLLRALTAYLGVNNICNQAFLTGLVVYLEVDQRRTATQVGLAFGTYGAGFLAAAVAAPSFGRHWGLGANVIASSLVSAMGIAALAVSAVDPAAARTILMILLGSFLVGFAAPVFNVQSVALRLSVTPSELLGRVTAIVKLVSQGSLPLGALAAGGLFAALRPAPAFTVIAAASFLATALLLVSPVRGQRRNL